MIGCGASANYRIAGRAHHPVHDTTQFMAGIATPIVTPPARAEEPARRDPTSRRLTTDEFFVAVRRIFSSAMTHSSETTRCWDELMPLDEDLRTELVDEPETRLPRPNPEAIAAWWATRRGRYVEVPRLIGGRPWSPDALIAALHTAPMRRRHLLALELQIRSGGALRVDTRSWTTLQCEQLATLDPSMSRMCDSLPVGRP
jgi:hypothetical protein